MKDLRWKQELYEHYGIGTHTGTTESDGYYGDDSERDDEDSDCQQHNLS